MLKMKILSLVTELIVILSPLRVCCVMNILYLPVLENLPSHCLTILTNLH